MKDITTRRSFLKRGGKGLAAAAAMELGASSTSQASLSGADSSDAEPNAFCLSRLRYITTEPTIKPWNHLPQYDDAFLQHLKRVASIKTSKKSFKERVVGIDDLRRAYLEPGKPSKVFQHPFLFMTGQSKFVFRDEERKTLAEYIKRGGFIWADDCVDENKSYFSAVFIKEIAKVLPGHKMERLPFDHEIYHCFHDIPNGSPYCWGDQIGDHGLFYKGRLVALLTPNDVHCGWARQTPRFIPHIKACLQLGVNVVIYALTH